MILLTRFPSGERLALNPDLIERAEEHPDTVVTLTDGTCYRVQERVEEIIEIVQRYRARVLALAQHLAGELDGTPGARLHLVRSDPPAMPAPEPEPTRP